MEKEWEKRFSGITRLYGPDAASKIAQSHICVIGVGGVGSWAVETLVRSGIGEITLIDPDAVCISNSNRQLPALEGNVGIQKTKALRDRILAINPHCQVHCIDAFLTKENITELISPRFDFVVDAIDSSAVKSKLISYCLDQGISMIVCGGAGGRVDTSRIQTVDLARSIMDPLLKSVRDTLRKEYRFPKNPKKKFKVDCIFSDEKPLDPYLESCDRREGTAMNCETGFGTACHITSIFGIKASAYVLSRITQ